MARFVMVEKKRVSEMASRKCVFFFRFVETKIRFSLLPGLLIVGLTEKVLSRSVFSSLMTILKRFFEVTHYRLSFYSFLYAMLVDSFKICYMRTGIFVVLQNLAIIIYILLIGRYFRYFKTLCIPFYRRGISHVLLFNCSQC